MRCLHRGVDIGYARPPRGDELLAGLREGNAACATHDSPPQVVAAFGARGCATKAPTTRNTRSRRSASEPLLLKKSITARTPIARLDSTRVSRRASWSSYNETRLNAHHDNSTQSVGSNESTSVRWRGVRCRSRF